MKIKPVCELTGLSDRTIRYYIEEGLISPDYTENYLGRRNYDFSEKDVKELNDITVLRKFDFMIAEIKTIINDIEASKSIIFEVKKRTETTTRNCQEKLTALSRISTSHAYSVAQLAEELSKPSLKLPAQEEKEPINILKIVLTVFKAIIVAALVWLPILLSLLVVGVELNYFRYPVFEPGFIIGTIITLLPSIAIMTIIPKIRRPFKRKIKQILLVFCAFNIIVSPIVSFGIISRSETTEFKYYLDLDADCSANRSIFFQQLFPDWPQWNAVYSGGAHYLYRNIPSMDYTYDIYVEWPLGKKGFYDEVARVKKLYDEYEIPDYLSYEIVKTGNYTCFFLYSGEPPFEEVSHGYTYFIFAYDEQNLKVRYILCDGLDGEEYQPYYLSLNW